MSQRDPLAAVNEEFGGKDKLVEKLVGLLESDESKDDLRKRLLGVANQKLLRLHRIASAVKEKFGSRDKLLAQAATAVGATKDKDHLSRLETFSTPRLLDVAQNAGRASRRAATKSAAPAAPKAKKAPAPKAATKKVAAKKPSKSA